MSIFFVRPCIINSFYIQLWALFETIGIFEGGYYSGVHTMVLYICVGFWLLAHLTHVLCQTEKKLIVVPGWANAQNDNYFNQK